MEISTSYVGNLESNGRFPKSLSKIKEQPLLSAVSMYPQGSAHSRTIAELLRRSPIEVEILQQNSDYAILRACPGRQSAVGHYIIGYDRQRFSTEPRLFIHNIPGGDIDLCSEAMWYILQWLNRAEDGFHRVQGDLLLRQIKDPWEIEQIEIQERDNPDFFVDTKITPYPSVALGNQHNFEGLVARALSNDNTDPRVVAKTEGKSKERTRHRVRVQHEEHQPVERASKRKKYHEGALQRRGEDGSWGGDD